MTTTETQLTQVPNNGHGMAPYMMSVALWVGCIAFSLMYPLTEYSGKLKSGVAWWLSKASVLYTIAVAQALVMVGALHAINGFDPARMGQTLLVACVASVTFMSVMYFFTNLMGKVGSFLMLVCTCTTGCLSPTPSPPSAVPSAAVRASPDAWLTWQSGWWSSRC